MFFKLGKLWRIATNNDFICCAKCGSPIEQLNIRARETGTFYCSNECATEDVNEFMQQKEVYSELDK